MTRRLYHPAWKEDQSRYGMPMPEEMNELSAQNPEADSYFHTLTLSSQLSLLYILGKPKRTQTRIENALVICKHLKENKGLLDSKLLVESLKNNRFKL